MNNDKKALRYAARLTCIYDYCCPGDMDREKLPRMCRKCGAFRVLAFREMLRLLPGMRCRKCCRRSDNVQMFRAFFLVRCIIGAKIAAFVGPVII